ncbi:MAG TPA: glucose 1-dehydrogenase [Tepidisphaeraceae bacterium]|jgi:gluconate 5-dehydrogenase|nr:glucose 1-dehydrogenase [Tepidisphaeraceae bacterium]
MKSFSLEGETALITGGGSGLGLGIAECFVEAGARVVLVGRRADVLKKAAAKLGDRAAFEVQDITHVDQAESLVQRATKHVGPVSILVNNAGVHLMKPAVETEVSEFNAMLQTHVVAAFALTRAVLPAMIERRHGSVLFIASMTSLFGIPKVVAYSAAKSAYLGIVRSLATEVSSQGVRVNAIAPGWIESDMMQKALAQDNERKERILDRTPMKGFGKSSDIGWAATYLASQAARFVTGVVLPVDGGASIGF